MLMLELYESVILLKRNTGKFWQIGTYFGIEGDPLDEYYVETRPYSSIPGAGEGLYAKVDIPKGTRFVLYSGFALRSENKDELQEKSRKFIELGLSPQNPEFEASWKYR
jgi:hypothetical protein